MKKIILLFSVLLCFELKSQSDNHESLISYWNTVNPRKEAAFISYVAVKHRDNFDVWKEENKILFIKEFWYYAESFYVKRDFHNSGAFLDESIIDVSRFEIYRNLKEEVTIDIPGFKDVIVLIPIERLVYKP